MIRFLCPGCQKTLAVKPERAGTLGTCPVCKGRFQIPDAPEPAPPAPPPPPAAVARARKSAPPPDDDRDDRDDDNDDDREPERPTKRKKKGKKKAGKGRKGGSSAFKTALLAIGVLTGLTFVVSLLWSGAALLLVVGGLGVMQVGSIWLIVIPFRESATQGLLCLFVPFYELYYIATNFEANKKPLLLALVGFVVSLVGVGVIAKRGLVI